MMAREFIVTPVSYGTCACVPLPSSHVPPTPHQPCEELALALQEVVDGFINSEVLKTVGSGNHGNQKRGHLDLDEDWEEYVPDVEYQVGDNFHSRKRHQHDSHSLPPPLLQLNSQAGGHLALLSSVLEPLVEGYWLAATQLLITLPHNSGFQLTGQYSLPDCCPL